ncbi:MAG: peroxide stress protein YaaA, partial [Actinomycetales bacterium]|nr:peroxide stress protein YaaA [Actinomycetales bacterium]
MLVLLPPSEGKTGPESGSRLKPSTLSFPGLAAPRSHVSDALVALCSSNEKKAATILDLGPQQLHLIDNNARLATAPTAPAIEIYTGVLYDALDFRTLPATARKRAATRVAISSALFGLLRPGDLIPQYRLSADTTIPGLGPLAAVWRDSIQVEVRATTGPILDLRSGAYMKLGPLPAETADRGFVGRILLEKAGKRSVVSHHNKATKGLLVREILEASKAPRSADDLPGFLEDL